MRIGHFLWAMALCAAAGGAADRAAAVDLDAALTYAARHTQDESDNDIFRLSTGLTWSGEAALRTRLGVELGVRNEDFSGDYPANYGLELVAMRPWAGSLGRQGLGVRARYAEDLTTTGELAYAVNTFGNFLDFRGLVGIQVVEDAAVVRNRETASGFLLGETTYFATDDLALSLALQGDEAGALYGVGVDWRPGRGPVSFFLEWGYAVSQYRDIDRYNDLTGGIRLVRRTESLKQHRRSGLDRVMHRYVEVQ